MNECLAGCGWTGGRVKEKLQDSRGRWFLGLKAWRCVGKQRAGAWSGDLLGLIGHKMT